MAAILTRSDGRVIASVIDCDLNRPGGFTVEEAQTQRARLKLANETVRTLCSDDVAAVLQGYGAEKLMDSLVHQKGYRVTVLPVGGA
jgi:hypothetical protein